MTRPPAGSDPDDVRPRRVRIRGSPGGASGFLLKDASPEVLRVRDAYLEVFSDLAPHAELVEALELACHVGKAARALTWDRALRALGDAEAGEHADAPLQCLRALQDDSYLGGA